MPPETFRYAVCGSLNTILGLGIYWVGLHFVFENQVFYAGITAFKPHNAALFLSSAVVFCMGFLMNKYIVFTDSSLRGRVQISRYFLSFFINLLANYFILKFFVEFLLWPAFPSQLLTTAFIIAISYVMQKHFTFRN